MPIIRSFNDSSRPESRPTTQECAFRYETRYILAFGWGIVFALIAIALILAFTARQAQQYLALQLDEELINRLVTTQKEADLSLVMLGNSRLRHAVTFGFDPEKMVALDDGRKLTALMFARNGARFNFYSSIAPQILSLEPDILVVQDAILTQSDPGAAWYVEYSLAAFNYLNSLRTKPKLEDLWLEGRMDISERCFEDFTLGPVARHINLNRTQPLHSLAADNTNRAAALAFIDDALEKGIRVIIVSLPADRKLGRMIGNSPHVMDFNGIGHYPGREELLPEYHGKVTWFAYESDAGSRFFCDFIHLNKLGRNYFTDHFLDSLRSLSFE
jgi:hypothetical protein